MEIPYQTGSAGKAILTYNVDNAKSSMDVECLLQYNKFLLECYFSSISFMHIKHELRMITLEFECKALDSCWEALTE